MQTKTQKLIDFIASHGFHAYVSARTDWLTVQGPVWGRNGTMRMTSETIPATWESVRNWLGY